MGSARYFLPELDLHVGVSAGRYLDRDWGWTAEASRFFHDVEIGFFLRDSERGSLAGIRLSLPLSPGTSLKPGWLRPRLPSGWSYGLHSTVFTERNVIRNDIARGIPGGRRLDDLFFDRDRLNPAYVKEHLADPAFWVWVR